MIRSLGLDYQPEEYPFPPLESLYNENDDKKEEGEVGDSINREELAWLHEEAPSLKYKTEIIAKKRNPTVPINSMPMKREHDEYKGVKDVPKRQYANI